MWRRPDGDRYCADIRGFITSRWQAQTRCMHTDIRGWIEDFRRSLATESTYLAIMGALQDLYNGLFFSLTSRRPLGTNVFTRDWELLLVLDACRVDAIEEVAPEYDFIDAVDSIWSVGSSSDEWAAKTYTTDYLSKIRETLLVSTNPLVLQALREQKYPPVGYSVPLMFADWDVVDENDLGEFLHIGEHHYKKYDLPPSPELMTEHAIKAARRFDFGRTIVHYMQPHIPHGAAAYAEERPPTDLEADPWQCIRNGAVDREDVWENYLDNLRITLDSIEILLKNIDAEKVVITADHGDLIGECGAYGHPAGFVHPAVKKVPWVVTSASDEGTRSPDIELPRRQSDTDVEDQLRTLGYL